MSRRILALVTFAIVAALVSALGACGGKQASRPIESRAPRSETLSLIPADTPYVFVALDSNHDTPWTPSMRDFHDAIAEETDDELQGNDPGARMVRRLLAELRDGPRIRTAKELGFSENGKFVIYGLSLWPVVRLAIEDPVKVRGLVGRVLSEAGSQVTAHTGRGVAYWVGKIEKLAIVVAVLDRELVLTVLPAQGYERALPLVFGHERPARTMVAEQMIDKEAARHGYLRDWFGYVDSKRVLDLLAGGGQGVERDLGALWQDSSLAGCKGDFERIAQAFPRLVFGYRRIDQKGVDAELLLEAPGLGAELSALRTIIPSLVAPKERPLFAMGIGANVGGTIDWLKSAAERLTARPFSCQGLDKLDDGFRSFANQVASLPGFVRTLQGVSLVVDDITLDPKSGTGTAVVVGDGIPMLVSMLWNVPPLGGLPRPTPGIPVAVPLDKLGIENVSSAHVGVSADRFAVTVGPDSGARISKTLAAPSAKSPLMWFALDVVRAEELGAFEGKDRTNIEKISTMSMTIDATSRGIVLGVSATWRPRKR